MSEKIIKKIQIVVLTGIIVYIISYVAGYRWQEMSTVYQEYTVKYGDNLYNIAEMYKPSLWKTEDYVAQIMQKNGLKSDVIHEGDKLILEVIK